jgi:hypothetical protein
MRYNSGMTNPRDEPPKRLPRNDPLQYYSGGASGDGLGASIGGFVLALVLSLAGAVGCWFVLVMSSNQSLYWTVNIGRAIVLDAAGGWLGLAVFLLMKRRWMGFAAGALLGLGLVALPMGACFMHPHL